MKNINIFIMLAISTLSAPKLFADTETQQTTTSIQNTAPAEITNNGSNTTTQSTTTTTTTTSTTVNPQDDAIVTAIYAKYAKDPALIGTTLTVSSQNGIVSISGTVTAQAQADAASTAAKSVEGVKDVRSAIKVITNPDINQSVTTQKY